MATIKITGPFWDQNAGDEYCCTGVDHLGNELTSWGHTREEAKQSFRETKQSIKARCELWDEEMSKLGFESCDHYRWMRDHSPNNQRLVGMTLWVGLVNPEATLHQEFEATLSLDTEADDVPAPQPSLYANFNTAFATPMEAAEFVIDEAKLAIQKLLEAF